MKRFIIPLVVLLSAVLITGCHKTGDIDSYPVEDFTRNLQVGKYIRYYLDSTLYISFGQKDTVVHYQAKDVVDAAITDNLGRPGFRIVRYLRGVNSTSEADWNESLTYQVIPTRETLELIENNLRFVKLRLPIREGYNWLGNSYLPDAPYYSIFQFNNDQDIQSWNYTYQDVGATETFNNKTYDSTISVLQIEDSINVPITFPQAIALKNLWIEKYAKNVGMVYKEVVMWEYQPPAGGNPGFRHGFGLKMSIIDHN
jgi:hypothetical protein